MKAVMNASLDSRTTNHFPADFWWLLGCMALLNACAMAFGSSPLALAPSAWQNGEWWRWLTYPFVHVSLYHLLLDGSAFLLLYAALGGWSLRRRLGALAACAVGSTLFALMSAAFHRHGLCGLSGVGHGLMAVVGLTFWLDEDDPSMKRAGQATFWVVLAKSVWEACTGGVLFAGLHGGHVGIPIVLCHLGGVAGGTLYALAYRIYGHTADMRRQPVSAHRSHQGASK